MASRSISAQVLRIKSRFIKLASLQQVNGAAAPGSGAGTPPFPGKRRLRRARPLSEVAHTGLKQKLILRAGNVRVEIVALSLGVAHLAEDAAVRLVIPSTAQTEPFGFHSIEPLGFPQG